ncbi:hypothetical protein RJZ56_003228 [Blastomyces dermatitidis]|uniref:Transcription initiation factor TFIID subunit 8 n=3 Tax=Blastomyces TaxID=229219 RepID=A0A179UMT2_BLAGS|nr:bromodomain associated protein [Blastomyces gilchristii SLH14081]XP_031578800.1 bromodomain associated protein, variant [Blastomyces gilchristii SLH14081]XP_045281765.1 bromodomain associated protein [Blastomyces dermatitidis ER-3]XP_045281766.1 bromodomain associated protein, variant [Blastomyces dermatitidis ER-3]EGE80373.1 bromodomain associated protein [Blastomyces dermatitidis ATCC 18188]EQL27777.1 hypothetical protein BDFG_09418 [Blastomyces dermatitidis ATCC 26199]EQL27778.1 hypothe
MAIPPATAASASSLQKRQRREYHHRLQTPMTPDLPDSAFTDTTAVDTLLKLSIGVLVHDCGFTHADPVALDSFRSAVEEYILHILSYTRQSMSSCRRMQPIPLDFEHAFRNTNIHLDSLHKYLTPPSPQREQQIIPPLPTPPPSAPNPATDLPFLGPDLSGTQHRQLSTHIPKHFPNFPSKHTYQETPVFTTRETDPRKIREKATEEGRLGEEALRKLARAGREGLLFRDGADGSGDGDSGKKLWGSRLESMESMFEKAVKGVVGGGGAGGLGTDAEFSLSSPLKVPENGTLELSPIVNCDRVYWRKQTRADVRKVDKRTMHNSNNKGARGALV